MSNQAPNWFVEQYNNKVRHKFQSKGNLLRGTVMPEGTIEGTKVYFPVAGKGAARKKVRGQEAIPMNASRGRVEAILETYEAFDEVYTFDLSRMGINEREVIAETGANALGRATDMEIFAKLNAAAATSGDNFIDASSANFTLVDAMAICQRLQKAEVPWDGNVFIPVPSLIWNQLLAYKQFVESGYVGPDFPLAKATTAKSWNGAHWFLVPDSYFISNAANTYDLFAYHRNAVGYGNNFSLKSIWDWDNRKGCHTVRMETEGACAVPLPEGVVRIRAKSNGTIVLN